MIYLLLGLIGLGILAAIFGLLTRKKEGEADVIQPKDTACMTCSGGDPQCETLKMLKAATQDIEYFDDEELDAFKGRNSDQYTDEEAQAFAEVMYTMNPGEVQEWNRSLALRGIQVPDQIKDELIALINEHPSKTS